MPSIRISFLILIFIIVGFKIHSQDKPIIFNPNPPREEPRNTINENVCDCSIVLTNSGSRDIGNLDEFSNQCDRTIEMVTEFGTTNILNSINGVMTRFGESRHPVCLSGRFSFENTIDIPRGTNLHLLPGTIVTYTGDGSQPAIEFQGKNSVLMGTDPNNPARISVNVPMQQGVIRVHSEDQHHFTVGGQDDVNHNQIKNLVLVNTGKFPASNAQDARNNRGVLLDNTPDFIREPGEGSGDRGSNYFTNISNIEIVGFSTGIHLRGESNGSRINNIEISSIMGHGYGIWISGCVDNSISNVRLRDCGGNSGNATGVRIDNYIREDFDMGFHLIDGIFIGQTDSPNNRPLVETRDILAPLIQFSDDQEDFNKYTLDNISSALYEILLLSECNTGGNDLDPSNESVLFQFGLKGYAEDDKGLYTNYDGDNTDIKHAILDGNCAPRRNPPCIFSEVLDTDGNPSIAATCNNIEVYPRYFLRPRFNEIVRLDVFDGAEKQVLNAVEIADSELDIAMEQVKNGVNDPAETITCDYGINNKVYLCVDPLVNPISGLVNINLSTDCGILTHELTDSEVLVNGVVVSPTGVRTAKVALIVSSL